jgi:hypothetical protein
MNSQIGKNASIDFDVGFLQPGDKLAVADAVFTGLGIDTGNPQGAENALLGSTITEGILTCLGDSLIGNTENTAAGTVVTLGLLQYFLVTSISNEPRLTRDMFLLLTSRLDYFSRSMRLIAGTSTA